MIGGAITVRIAEPQLGGSYVVRIEQPTDNERALLETTRNPRLCASYRDLDSNCAIASYVWHVYSTDQTRLMSDDDNKSGCDYYIRGEYGVEPDAVVACDMLEKTIKWLNAQQECVMRIDAQPLMFAMGRYQRDMHSISVDAQASRVFDDATSLVRRLLPTVAEHGIVTYALRLAYERLSPCEQTQLVHITESLVSLDPTLH